MSNRTRAGVHPAGLGYVVDDIRREASHMTYWQAQAAQLIVDYLSNGSVGCSDGLVGQISTKVDCSMRPRSAPPYGGGWLDERTARQLRQLRQHEIELLSRIAFGRGRCLEEYGKINSGYKANRTARAFAIGRVTALLESVAELAELKPTAAAS